MSGAPHAVSDDDWITLLVVIVLAFASGIVSVGMFLDPIQDWMLQYHLLEQGEAVLIPLVDGVGFGLGQVLVLGALLIVGITLIVWAKRRASARV